ncbi:hypothetical protein [Candidatus Cyanaurora vandensis]|uniref:hypothetical protein n=1 Tax=Candidatus Cyanaurora vandensis TaxID=2714958 RepID=UPI00257AEC6A|nr:hypothetical protein [Candidatus Cyanaurora vandensis]
MTKLHACLILPLVFLVSACTTSPPPAVNLPTLSVVDREPSRNLRVNYFIDATESMEGFAERKGRRTAYQELLTTLEDAALNLSPTPQFTKYRFGNKLAVVSGRLGVTAGQDKNFYDSKVVGTQTQIQQALLNPKNTCVRNGPEELTIVVTDLFQTDSDIGRVVSTIQQCFLAQGRVVGLLGVQSDFSGMIYDFPGGPLSLAGGKRPVYALVLGKYANVQAYFEAIQLISPSLKPPTARYTIFSPRVFLESPDFFKTDPTDNRNNLIKQGFAESKIYQLETQGEPVDFTVCGDTPRPLSKDIAGYRVPQEGQFIPTVRHYPLSEGPATVLNDSRMVEVTPGDCANGLGLQVKVDPARLQVQGEPRGHYLFQLAFRPSPQGYPKQWDAWNTEDVPRNPRKTLNLSRFIKSLYGATLTREPDRQEVILRFFLTRF